VSLERPNSRGRPANITSPYSGKKKSSRPPLGENQIAEGDILVSYDVASLFTNVPVDETNQILLTKRLRKNGSTENTT
jgi:hypothetical protein